MLQLETTKNYAYFLACMLRPTQGKFSYNIQQCNFWEISQKAGYTINELVSGL